LKLSPAQAAVKAPSAPRLSSINASPTQMTRAVSSLMRKPYQEVPALDRRPCADGEPDFGAGMRSAAGW
jgi:hypothetical protein